MEKRELSPETRRHLDKSVEAISEEFDEVASPKRVRDVVDEQLAPGRTGAAWYEGSSKR